MALDQNTDKREGDRVQLRQAIDGVPAGAIGTVRRGFARLLGVHFDEYEPDMCQLLVTGHVYVVNLCDRIDE